MVPLVSVNHRGYQHTPCHPRPQVQCTKPECRKWRQLTKEIQLTASLAATYRCGMKFNNIKVKMWKWKLDCETFCADFCLFVCRVRGQTTAPNQKIWWASVFFCGLIHWLNKNLNHGDQTHNFLSHREWLKWLTAGGIQCWSCRRSSKTVQPAPSSLPTTLTVWGWVLQAPSATSPKLI